MKNKTANPLWQKIVSPEAVALMKLVHSFHRGILPAEIGKNMLEALKPFINIVCSALILDGLIALCCIGDEDCLLDGQLKFDNGTADCFVGLAAEKLSGCLVHLAEEVFGACTAA